MTDAPTGDGRDSSSPPQDANASGGGLSTLGTVHASAGGVYRVVLEDGTEVEATLRGRLKKKGGEGRGGGRKGGSGTAVGDQVVIGDRVRVSGSRTEGYTIEEVLPRVTAFVRRGPGGRRARVVVANLDRVLVVVAAREPDMRLEQVDRLLAVAEAGGMHPILVVNKVDLPGAAEVTGGLQELYGGVGYRVLGVSAAAGTGMDAFAELVCEGSSALVGPSGAGKSTLLNTVDPRLHLPTGALSRKTRRGRHTTVSARLLELSCGGRVADTPGFGDVGVWGVEPGEVAACFPEFEAYRGRCRFRGCSHTVEPGCAVREAVAEGAIPESRYESYLRLYEESVEAARR
ncbi:MAG: ribosome small subunit-dependent GTPase A [Gemmatimonadota bacterium]